MLTHGNWSAWIAVDGEELTQYSTEITSETAPVSYRPYTQTSFKVSCWIPSSEGKEFKIYLKKNAEDKISEDFSALVYTDGILATTRVLRVFDSTGRTKSTYKIDGQLIPQEDTKIPFLFTQLPLTDDDSAPRDVSHLEDLGTIRIDIRRVTVSGSFAGHGNMVQGIAAKGPIHEKSKKSGAHCVSFGKPVARDAMPTLSIKDTEANPFLTFEFRYRSADILRAQGIIQSFPKTQEDSCDMENAKGKEEGIQSLKARLTTLEKRRPGGNDDNGNASGSWRSKKPKVEAIDMPGITKGN